jgi:hypothetical protein
LDEFLFAEHAVMLTFDFGKFIANRFAEVVVRPKDRARRVELDDRQRSAHCVEHILSITLRGGSEMEHFCLPGSAIALPAAFHLQSKLAYRHSVGGARLPAMSQKATMLFGMSAARL